MVLLPLSACDVLCVDGSTDAQPDRLETSRAARHWGKTGASARGLILCCPPQPSKHNFLWVPQTALAIPRDGMLRALYDA